MISSSTAIAVANVPDSQRIFENLSGWGGRDLWLQLCSFRINFASASHSSLEADQVNSNFSCNYHLVLITYDPLPCFNSLLLKLLIDQLPCFYLTMIHRAMKRDPHIDFKQDWKMVIVVFKYHQYLIKFFHDK